MKKCTAENLTPGYWWYIEYGELPEILEVDKDGDILCIGSDTIDFKRDLPVVYKDGYFIGPIIYSFEG